MYQIKMAYNYLGFKPNYKNCLKFGKEIELTTKEYALLEYLMRNKNRIISRSMITQHVWKHNFDPESNIIDVYIKRIRSKIERPG